MIITATQKVLEWYKFLNEDLADPRTKDLFLIGTPWHILILLGCYLYFILNFGPKIMEKKQPIKLERIIQIYNTTQILLNIYLLRQAFDLMWDYSFICEPVDFSYTPKAVAISRLCWQYFMVKIMDLVDTIFFVLRKKQNQVSFLHLYHHFGMVLGTWGATKYLPGGHVAFLGLLNAFVHSIMYTYYLLSSMKIDTSSWKKYITQLQLIQFFLILLHYLQLLWVEDCGFPLWPLYIMVPQNIFMIILFGEFYYKTYIKEKPTTKTLQKKAEVNKINSSSTEVSNGKPKEQ